MSVYWFKAYFKDLETDRPFILPISKISSTLEAARQRVFVDCQRYEVEYDCKLLYLYTDTDMKEGAINEN